MKHIVNCTIKNLNGFLCHNKSLMNQNVNVVHDAPNEGMINAHLLIAAFSRNHQILLFSFKEHFNFLFFL